MFLYVFSCLIRIYSIVPILYSPILGWTIIFVFDLFDYALSLRSGMTWNSYQTVDKNIDILNRIYLLISSYLIFSHPIFLLFLFLFSFRLIGDILYIFTRSEKYFFFFPNIFELFYLVYYLSLSIFWSFLLVIPIKVLNEYILHIKNYIDPISKNYIKKHPEHMRSI